MIGNYTAADQPRFLPRRSRPRGFALAALVRQWEIMRLLEGRGYTVHELSGRVHVSWLLIIRDLRVIERAGFPIYDTIDDEGVRRWRLASSAPHKHLASARVASAVG